VTHQDDVDARLARLTKATEKVAAHAQFADRVMIAVEAEAVGWWSDIPRIARRAVPAFALVAALAVAWAVHGSREVDDALVGSFDAMEIEW